MEPTELSQPPDLPEPSVLTTWTPAADPSAWRDDPEPLPATHLAHLADGESPSSIRSVLRVAAPFDPAALRRALTAWTARHEELRTTPVGGLNGVWKRTTVPEARVCVVSEELGRFDAATAARRLDAVLDAVSPYAWPHCVVATIVDPADDQGFTLVLGADPSVMDAWSQLLWCDEIVALYGEARSGAVLRDLAAATLVE